MLRRKWIGEIFSPQLIRRQGLPVLGHMLRMLPLLGVDNVRAVIPESPADADLPTWASEYPSHFHETIRLIGALLPQPEGTVDKVLNKNFRKADAIKREIAKLRQKVEEHPDSPHLHQRLTNLHIRLHSHRAVSEGRINTLRERLEKRLFAHVFQVSATAIEHKAIQVLSQHQFRSETEPFPNHGRTLWSLSDS